MTVLYSQLPWTYGVEHEWADWDMTRPLPEGYKRDTKDVTIVNSSGIANDPVGKYHQFGGEINTPPTDDIQGQISCLQELLDKLHPAPTINYRSNLHIHVRLPGLRDDLETLKQLQLYIHQELPKALPVVEPLPRPNSMADLELDREDHMFAPEEVLAGAQRRWRRRRVSHQTLLTPERLDRQLKARSTQMFFEREVPESKRGRPLWHCQPRLCVSLRQLLDTDTIEFRHFPGTLDPQELRAAMVWCKKFLEYALTGSPIETLVERVEPRMFPAFKPYKHHLERNYRATVHDGTLDKATIAENIRQIEAGAQL